MSRLQNLRDIGGLALADGGQTRFGVLFRSDAPMPGDTQQALQGWPPATVIDLRDAPEKHASHPLTASGSTVHSVPLSARLSLDDMGSNPIDGGLRTLYPLLLSSHAGRFVTIAELVASSAGPILVHCAAGKDRTGIAIAIMLSAIGVSRAAVEQDYALTDANMTAVVERAFANLPPEQRQESRARYAAYPPEVFTAPRWAIAGILDTLDEHGGADRWLVGHGLSPGVIEALRSKLAPAGR